MHKPGKGALFTLRRRSSPLSRTECLPATVGRHSHQLCVRLPVLPFGEQVSPGKSPDVRGKRHGTVPVRMKRAATNSHSPPPQGKPPVAHRHYPRAATPGVRPDLAGSTPPQRGTARVISPPRLWAMIFSSGICCSTAVRRVATRADDSPRLA